MSANLTMNQALSVWSELEQAYFGRNGYGGDVAEIYAYRLQPYSPTASAFASDTELGLAAKNEQAKIAGDNLYWLLKKFCEDRGCGADVDGDAIEILLVGLSHRCHVKIFRREQNEPS